MIGDAVHQAIKDALKTGKVRREEQYQNQLEQKERRYQRAREREANYRKYGHLDEEDLERMEDEKVRGAPEVYGDES